MSDAPQPAQFDASEVEPAPEAITVRRLWPAVLLTLLTWVPLAALDLQLQTPVSPGGIVSVELAFRSARLEAIVAAWPDGAMTAAAWSLALDYLFMGAYAWLFSSWVRAVGLRLREHSPLVSGWASTFARAAWLAAALDAIENAALAVALRAIATGEGAPAGWVLGAGICAALKFLLLIAVLFYGLNGAVAWRMARARGVPPG